MQALLKRMVDAVREEDPTRLIDPESGIGGGGKNPDGTGAGNDIFDFKLGDVLDYHAYAPETPKAEKNRAAVFGEYGWAHIRDRAFSLIERSKDLSISGIVLVQLTDVENEENGALTYTRAETRDTRGAKRKRSHRQDASIGLFQLSGQRSRDGETRRREIGLSDACRELVPEDEAVQTEAYPCSEYGP